MTLTQADVVSGTITQSEMDYSKATFMLKKGTSVSADEKIEITEDYTSLSSTSSVKIFDGRVEDASLTDVKDITATSEQDEVARIQPFGIYQGLTTVRLSDIIRLYGDFLSAGYGPTTYTGYYNAPYNFAGQAGRTGTDIDFVNALTLSPTSVSIVNLDGHNAVLKIDSGGVIHNFPGPRSTGTVDLWFQPDDVSAGSDVIQINDVDNNVILYVIRNTTANGSFICTNNAGFSTYCDFDTDGEPQDDVWYRISITWNGDDTYDVSIYESDGTTNCKATLAGLGTLTDGVNPAKIILRNSTGVSHWDAFGFSWDVNYTVANNAAVVTYDLPVATYSTDKNLSGGQTLQSLLAEGAITEQGTWAIAYDGDIRWHAGTDDSGVILDGTQEVWDVRAKQQIKRVNRVVLKGAGGLEAVANDTARQTSSGQIIIYKDYRADITNQTDLDVLATQLLGVQKDPPLAVQLSLRWEAKGWIQVGEYIHIEANSYKYNKSSTYIPHADYRIKTITYHMVNGVYNYVELDLEDGLQYVLQTPDDKIDHNTQNANTAYGGTIIQSGGSSGGGGGINSIVEDATPQLGGDLDLNGFNLDFATTANISDCLDEDNMVSDSATKLATQQSIKAYADLMLPLAGGTMSGGIDMDGNNITTGAGTVDGKDVSTLGTDAEAHAYVEANALTITGGIEMSGVNITMAGAETVDGKDVSTLIANVSEDSTPQLGGDLDLNGNNIDFPTTADISDCLDEGDLVSNSATMLATQQSIKTYADAKVSNTAFDDPWNGVTTIAPSKDAVYDVVNPLTAGIVYAGTWDPTDPDGLYPLNLESGADGDTSGGATSFVSVTATFETNGVAIGDVLLIEDEDDEGWYVITEITNETTLVIADGGFGGDTDATYQVFDAGDLTGGEFYISTKDGQCYDYFYEFGDWIVYNATTNEWDHIRTWKGDNYISVEPGSDIQVAIDEIESVGSGTVFLQPGTHTLTASLTINNVDVDITIEGVGDGSIIDVADDRAAINLTNCNSCILKNFYIDATDVNGPDAGTAIVSINEANDNKVLCDNISIVGTDGTNGAGFYIASDNVELRNCHTENLATGIEPCGNYNTITDCTVIGDWQWSGIYGQCNYSIIQNNYITGGEAGMGIYLSGGTYNVISGNIIHTCTGAATDAIRIHNASHYNVITDNNVYNIGDNGIELSTNCDYNLISNNRVDTCVDTGILIGAGCDNNTIGPNHFYNNGTDFTDSGGTNKKHFPALDEDAMGSDSAVNTATQQSIKAYVDTTYGAASHVRQLSPMYCYPENMTTAGANNAYYDTTGGWFRHGVTSNGQGWIFMAFALPDDYTDGGAMTLRWMYKIPKGAGTTATLAYTVRWYLAQHTDPISLEATDTSTHGPLNAAHRWRNLSCTCSAPGNFTTDDHVVVWLSMDDNAALIITESQSAILEVAVTARD